MSTQQRPERVAVLMGGWSGEREVSLTSGKACAAALSRKGFQVLPIDVTADIPAWMPQMLAFAPDVVFVNALHGIWVEDGCLQGLLEMLGLPYTNSGVLSSALAMDKVWTRRLLAQAGIPIPAGDVYEFSALGDVPPMPYPFIMKPVNEGSSLGVSIIRSVEDFAAAKAAWSYGVRVLIEDYIPGREVSVAVLGGKALGMLELRPKEGFYDYAAKYVDGKTDHVMPADLPVDLYNEGLRFAEQAYRVLECQGAARVDMRFDDVREKPGNLYVLEINTQPGMTPLSILPEIAAYRNISFEDLLEWMVINPICPKENPHIKKYQAAPKHVPDEPVLRDDSMAPHAQHAVAS